VRIVFVLLSHRRRLRYFQKSDSGKHRIVHASIFDYVPIGFSLVVVFPFLLWCASADSEAESVAVANIFWVI
jgi:hypothetical protein